MMLLGCSKTILIPYNQPIEVEYLKECSLYDYTETELAYCYISLTEEVRLGNTQLHSIEQKNIQLQGIQ